MKSAEQFLRDKYKLVDFSNLTINGKSWLELMEEYADEQYDYYCPKCESCGEEGCCSPINCERVKCTYGEKYVEDYKFSIEFSDKVWSHFKDDAKISKIHSDLWDKYYKK